MKFQFLFFTGAMASIAFAAPDQLVVHEWGTFTSLQDEAGTTVPGINTDEAPLPAFVHSRPEGTPSRDFVANIPEISPSSTWKVVEALQETPENLEKVRAGMKKVVESSGAGKPAPSVEVAGKTGTAQLKRQITMRLETPVVYFYPSKDAALPIKLDVRVKFRGGWLTEFYPAGATDWSIMDLELGRKTVGELTWTGLNVGVDAAIPQTDDRVWLAPRAPESAVVSAHSGDRVESEKYLFYRGVGNLDAPLKVLRNGGVLQVCSQLDAAIAPELSIRKLWLVESRPNGSRAFRTLAGFTARAGSREPGLKTADRFADADFAPENLAGLRGEMNEALIEDGLFADEADALLNTWEASYFNAPGQRLFFLVPRAWTDKVLPLEISQPCAFSRSMVGRIELVTPEHRAALQAMEACAAPTQPLPTIGRLAETPVSDDPMARAYYSLGRFRNALVMHAARSSTSKTLLEFARLNGLR